MNNIYRVEFYLTLPSEKQYFPLFLQASVAFGPFAQRPQITGASSEAESELEAPRWSGWIGNSAEAYILHVLGVRGGFCSNWKAEQASLP